MVNHLLFVIIAFPLLARFHRFHRRFSPQLRERIKETRCPHARMMMDPTPFLVSYCCSRREFDYKTNSPVSKNDDVASGWTTDEEAHPPSRLLTHRAALEALKILIVNNNRSPASDQIAASEYLIGIIHIQRDT